MKVNFQIPENEQKLFKEYQQFQKGHTHHISDECLNFVTAKLWELSEYMRALDYKESARLTRYDWYSNDLVLNARLYGRKEKQESEENK